MSATCRTFPRHGWCGDERTRLVMWLGAIAVLLGGGHASEADTIYLKDGREIHGKITQRTEDFVVIESGGVTWTYVVDDVDRVEFGPSPSQASSQSTTESGAAAPAESALIDQVLAESGVNQQMEQVELLLAAQLNGMSQDERLSKLSPEARAKLSGVMTEAFKADLISSAIAETFRSRFDQQKLQAVLVWFTSPAGRRMVQLDTREPDPQEQEAEQFFAELQQHPPAPERLELVRQLSKATGAGDSMLNVNLAVMGGLGEGLTSSGALSAGTVEEQIAKTRDLYQTQYRDQIESNALSGFLYTYRTRSDEELRSYVEFWESDAGRWFSQLLSDSITRAMGAAAGRMGSQLQAIRDQLTQESPKGQ